MALRVDLPLPALAPGALDAYRASLDRVAPLLTAAHTVIPGHGTPCGPDEAIARLDRDRMYIEALTRPGGADLPHVVARDPRMERASNREAYAAIVAWIGMQIAP